MHCAKCSAHVPIEANYCNNCGTDVRGAFQPKHDSTEENNVGEDYTRVDNITDSKSIAVGEGNRITEIGEERQGEFYIETFNQRKSYPDQRGCYANFRKLSFAIVIAGFIMVVLVWIDISPQRILVNIIDRFETLAPPIPTLTSSPTATAATTNIPIPALTSSPTATAAATSIPIPTLIKLPTGVPIHDLSTKQIAIDTLKNSKTITIAYATDAEPFSFEHNGEPKGYEIDLLHDFFRDLLDIAPNELLTETFVINWIDVEIPERVKAATWPNEKNLGKEHIDMVVGAVSGTTERCDNEFRICTQPHFTDYAALLVKSDSLIDDFCSLGLEKQNIVFQTATTPGEDAETATTPEEEAETAITPEENAEAEIGSENFSSECTEHITYGEKQERFYKKELIEAVLNNEDGIVSYITDSIILEASRRAHSPENALKVVGQSMNAEKYIFIMRAENDGLRDLLNGFLTEHVEQWETNVKSDLQGNGYVLRESK